jgi:hypothetical protein
VIAKVGETVTVTYISGKWSWTSDQKLVGPPSATGGYNDLAVRFGSDDKYRWYDTYEGGRPTSSVFESGDYAPKVGGFVYLRIDDSGFGDNIGSILVRIEIK